MLPLIAVASMLAGGCATKDVRPGAKNPATVTQSINLSGYPPEFQRGFREGCDAANANKSATKPKGDNQHAIGWNDGFDYCLPRK